MGRLLGSIGPSPSQAPSSGSMIDICGVGALIGLKRLVGSPPGRGLLQLELHLKIHIVVRQKIDIEYFHEWYDNQ